MHFDGNVGCHILQECADLLVKHKFVVDVCKEFYFLSWKFYLNIFCI